MNSPNRIAEAKFILGSASPRRVEILNYFSLPFKQIIGDFDEESIVFENNLEQYATKIASQKAFSIYNAHKPELPILTADTVVYLNGKTYGKPKDEEQAIRFLSELQGQTHTVLTAMALLVDGNLFTVTDSASVKIFSLSNSEILHYLKTTHWQDKAGSYAVQGSSGIIVEEIHGCYTNVMGLSIRALKDLLNNAGINLWDHL